MSAYNIKLKVWTSKTTGETRVYADGRYVEYRNIQSHCEGYFVADENGSIDWRHGFRTGPDTIRKAEMNAMAMKDLLNHLNSNFSGNGVNTLTFAELLERIAACQTKGGNFSMRQYEKKYQL